MSFSANTFFRPLKRFNLMSLSLVVVFCMVFVVVQDTVAQSTTTRNRIRQAVVVRRQRPVVGSEVSVANSSSSENEQTSDQEKVLAAETEDQKSATNDTFFSPFLNGFNQFNTRFNPFGRTPQQGQQQSQQQQQQSFQQFPSSNQPFTQFAPQTGGAPGGNPGGNFQTVRLPNGQVVSQNSQFGVISPQQQFPSFAQQPTQPPQQLQQRPLQSASGLSDFRSQPLQRFPNSAGASTSEFSGPTSVNFQTFGFQTPSPPTQPPPVEPQILTLPDLPLEEENRNRVPISSFPVRERPEETQAAAEADFTASRGQSRFRGRPNEDDPTESTRVLRVRPNRPSTEATRFGDESFASSDFNAGTEAAQGTTPPPLLTRLRGRPIVPDDFPGPSQAVRGSVPSEAPFEDVETEDPDSTGPRSSIFNGKLRPGVRIVPTGNRARRPLHEEKEPELKPAEPLPEDKPEEPRFTNSGRPINHITPLDEEEEVEDTEATGSPRRRLRPVNRISPGSSTIPLGSSTIPPRRRLRPFSQDPLKPGQEQEAEEEIFDDTVPTVPSRLPTSPTTSIPETSEDVHDTRTTSAGVDPNLLIAQVQAVRADEENRPSKLKGTSTSFDDEDNEENNLIPFADVPHGDSEANHDSNPIPDKDITVINLQKDRAKQNFKGFVDTDLIDDNLRLDENPESEAPSPDPVPSPPPFIPTPLLVSQEPVVQTTTTPQIQFVPTSLPSNEPSTETINTDAPPETVQPTDEDPSEPPQVEVTTIPPSPPTTTLQQSSPTTTPSSLPPFSESTTVTPSSTTSPSSSSSVSLNDELDRLQSSLDPWARLHEDDDEASPKTTTPEPITTTTKISLFKIRTYSSVKTTTTTTFKPKSLIDLLKHRNGEKVPNQTEDDETSTKEIDQVEEQATEQVTEHSEEDRSSNKIKGGDRIASKFGKHQKENTETPEDPDSESKTDSPSQRLKLFVPSDRSTGIASHFVPKVKQVPVSEQTSASPETTTTTTTTLTTSSTVEETTKKQTSGKDLLSSIPLEDVTSLLPEGFDKKVEPSPAGTIIQDDISKFLPPGFKLEETTSSTTESSTSLLLDILSSIEKKDKHGGDSGSSTGSRLGGFRPHGGPANRPFKSKTPDAQQQASTESSKSSGISGVMSTLTFDDIGAFLPPGFKESTTEKPDFSKEISSIFKEGVIEDDVSAFLPPGFKPEFKPSSKPEPKVESTSEATPQPTTNPSQEPPTREPTTTTESNERFGVKFPVRPGGVQNVGLPDVGKHTPGTPAPPTPKIKSFSDIVKSTTEFSGWSTEDAPIGQKIDIKQLLASTSTSSTTVVAETTTTETTTTTTTTTTTRSTTSRAPGYCDAECRLAATLRISDGYEWSNSLLDPKTFEFQDLAGKIQRELTEVFRNSLVSDSFERLEIEAFSKGSIIVDYYVYFKQFEEKVSTKDIKEILNQQLESQDGTTKLGKFIVDPDYTDFIVVPRELSAPATDAAEESGLPDWAIAVIVIGLGSFAFVLIFGITVLTNKRRRQSRKKHDLPLTEDMLNELNKTSLSGGYSAGGGSSAYDNYGQDPDEFYDMEDVWNNDRYYGQQKYKRQPNTSSSSGGGGYSKSNPYQSQLYDSWKTEWNAPYTEQYRTGPSGVPSRGSSAEMVPSAYRSKGTSYMTKGGRRPVYDDDF